MFKMDFNPEMSLKEIYSSFKTLIDNNIESYIDIDGVLIYTSDSDYKKRIKYEYLKYKDKYEKKVEVKFEKPSTNEIDDLILYRTKLENLSKNPFFVFNIRNIMHYTKEGLESELLKHYVEVYAEEGDCIEKHIHYISTLLFIASEDTSYTEKQYKIQQLLNSANSEDERIKLLFAVTRIKQYIECSDKIIGLLHMDYLDNEIDRCSKKIERLLEK